MLGIVLYSNFLFVRTTREGKQSLRLWFTVAQKDHPWLAHVVDVRCVYCAARAPSAASAPLDLRAGQPVVARTG